MEWNEMLVGSGSAMMRTVIVGILAYAALVLLLRGSGKRTLSKFNAFDFVVTIALGSTLASVLVTQQVSLLQGVTAFLVLMGLQYAITWLSVRSRRVRDLVKGEPALLLLRGEPLEKALRRERITHEELHAAVRDAGLGSTREVEAAVLETDGTITVVKGRPEGPAVSLHGTRGYPARDGEATQG